MQSQHSGFKILESLGITHLFRANTERRDRGSALRHHHPTNVLGATIFGTDLGLDPINFILIGRHIRRQIPDQRRINAVS